MFRKMKLFVAILLVLGVCSDAVLAELIGYWPFDEGKGTEAADMTGNGNDGTFNGDVEWVLGYVDKAVRFDTAGERVVVGPIDPTAGTDAMALAAWINWEGEGHTISQQGIIGKRRGWDPGDGVKWFWQTNPAGDFLFRADSANGGGGGGLGWGNGLIAPYANEWIHVAVSWDNGAVVQYINGEQVSSGNINFIDTADDTPVTIGCVDSGNNETFVGTIDEARIYNHALTQAEIQTIMLGIFPTAFKPFPADGAMHEDTWVSLSWEPGTSAASHDVYFGDNFDDVDAGAESVFQANQAAEFLVVGFPGFAFPDGLVPGTTYYWRIDEVEADGTTKHQGTVWSFAVPSKTAYFPDPADGAESVDINVKLSWTGGFGSKLHYVYFGDNFDDVNNAAGALPNGTTDYSPGTLTMAKTYYWRVDEFDIVETHKGDVWSFITEGAVSNPVPVKGAVDVSQTATLTWTPGVFGASHEVYFGTDAGSLELKSTGSIGSESYNPGQLEWNTTYYWRVDEANNTNADSPWTGPLWSFTTANFLIIDDMESYNDLDEGEPGSNRIYLAWADGFDNPAVNGSVVGNANAPFAEQTIVHGDLQSMPMSYDNAVGKSEATLTLTSNRDWTVKGVNTLTIWFRGSSSNTAEPMYVALNGNAVVNNDNPDAANATSWTEWNIDLQAFADQGVNLANVNSITIGLGDKNNPVAGGTGMMYFDDIRLYDR
ncbi:MAG: LamG-like jellyroll fold domain-containing protein [Sedimentisphaerales bacterium]|nr:LamG-like jellyroll fold domain-containing protein [Sedimentisphaerales bacterium]